MLFTQFDVYKSFQFVVELLLAEYVFTNKFRRRRYFALRTAGGLLFLFTFAFFFPVPVNNPFYLSFVFFSIFLINVAVNVFMYKEKFLSVLFCCIAGYTTQHFAYECYNIFLTAIDVSASVGIYGDAAFSGVFGNAFIGGVYAFIYVLVYFLCYLFFGSRLTEGENISLETKFIFVFGVLILVIDIVLNAVVVKNPIADGKLYSIIISVYNVICCIVSLYLQFEASSRKEIEKTLDAVQLMWRQQKEQYAISKENIELINMKCHDLKHYVYALNGGSIDEKTKNEIEKSISIYDSMVTTGNDALDVILMEKSLLCNHHSIRITIIADGKQLNFMSSADIYALFGNILDNAIEAVEKLEEQNRTISLQIKCVNGVITVRERNYCKHELVFKDGLPVTTKDDSRFHGFGLKSIEYICNRYGGTLSVGVEEGNIFNLCIIFFKDETDAERPKQQ